MKLREIALPLVLAAYAERGDSVIFQQELQKN